MDIKRYRIVAVGAEQPDVLTKITKELTLRNHEIEAISSLRLGHSIVVVCIIEAFNDVDTIEKSLKHVVEEYDIHLTVDECSREKFKFIKSDTFMRVRGGHIPGIKAYLISELIEAGLDIHGFEADTYGDDGNKQFMVNIKGQACNGIDSLSQTVNKLQKQELDVAVANDWKLLV